MADGKLLVIDDDEGLTSLLKQILEEEGYQVQVAFSGMEGLRRLFQWQPDMVILDVVLPGMDGWTVCHRIREVSDVPVLMLTLNEGDDNEVRGLRVGADLYMRKPFSARLLIARVDALLRRSRLAPSNSARDVIITVRDMQINLAKHEVVVRGQSIDLSPTEFRLLVALASKSGQVVARSDLLAKVWGPEYSEEDLYLKLYIRYLRQKIEEDPSLPSYILTKRGVGYYLSDGSGWDDQSESNREGALA